CREGTVSVAVGPDDFLSAIPGRQRTVRTTGKIFPTGRPTGRELLLPHPPVVLSGSLTPRMQGVASVLDRHEIPRPHQPVFLRPVATVEQIGLNGIFAYNLRSHDSGFLVPQTGTIHDT